MNIERSTSASTGLPVQAMSYRHVKHLVEQASSDGLLTREEDDSILAAIVSSQSPTAEMCALFRALQEQVWDGELILET